MEKQPIIAALGDSVTFGAGVRNRQRESWPAVLEELLDGQYRVVNFGACGATMCNDGDVPYWGTGLPEQAVAMEPEVVLLALGTNDSKVRNWNRDSFRRDYEIRIRQILSWPGIHRLILLSPPFAGKVHGAEEIGFHVILPTLRDEIVPIVRRLAAEYGLFLVDLYALTENRLELFSDGVHPNAQGNRLIAGEIARLFLPGQECSFAE